MKKTLLILLAVPATLLSCSKNDMDLAVPPVAEACVIQTSNPSGRIYTSDSVVAYNCTSKHCGLLPLSTKNYWVYQDSIYYDGVFQKVQLDTLRFTKTWKSLADDLTWWEANMTIGLPVRMYANDSTIYSLEESYFIAGKKNSRREFGQISTDSTRYLSSFEDMAAQAKVIRLSGIISAPAGNFTGCIYFEKFSRSYRKDQVIFKPGIGVVRYVREMAAPGSPFMKLQQVSNLVSIHIE
ncbi:MAG: hypothetical protein NTW29_08500 [Bacteroidetes bacterium]|nr:hypothetical protein [Bacteroidota bacterium]